MKIDVLSQNDKELKFSVKGISYAFANELRRIMVSEVATMAIEWVDFKKNDSAIPDELLANRLGQVPLTFDKKAYNIKETCDNCKGKGCSRCQVELVLKKKGPGIVYSGDLKSKAKDVQPVFDKIPLVELFEGQELQFEAIAQLGKGRNHAKWQASVVGYKYDGDNFIFNVESVSGLEPDEIIAQAVDAIEEKASQFGKLLGKLE
jgi:DNA-directed RNA polymerase subunit D